MLMYMSCFRVRFTLHMSLHRGGRWLQANLILWRILKDFLSSLKHIVIILIRFITQAEGSAFLPFVFHSQEKLERNKGGWASQSGPIVPHTVTSGVCKKLTEWVNTWLWEISSINFGLFFHSIQEAFIFLEHIFGFWNHFPKIGRKQKDQRLRPKAEEVKVEMADEVAVKRVEGGGIKGCYGTSKWYLG